MKNFLHFLRSTLADGVMFLLPIALLVFLLKVVFEYLMRLAKPLSDRFPDKILFFDGSITVTLLALLVICFLGGLLFHSKWLRERIHALEDQVLFLFPGYLFLKSITSDLVGDTVELRFKPVLIQDDDSYTPAFLIEDVNGWSTVYVPESPKQDSGEVSIIPSKRVVPLQGTSLQLRQSLKRYGKGMAAQLESGK